MEADWEVEIGAGAPIVEAFWPGFVDLRSAPERIGEIEEARQFPKLEEALLQLNGAASKVRLSTVGDKENELVWTSKCDTWVLNSLADSNHANQMDSDEMDATPEESVVGIACYIDLFSRAENGFSQLEQAEVWVRANVRRLRQIPVRCSRVDLIVREAVIGERDGFAVTAYVTACGADESAARAAFGNALAALVDGINGRMESHLSPVSRR